MTSDAQAGATRGVLTSVTRKLHSSFVLRISSLVAVVLPSCLPVASAAPDTSVPRRIAIEEAMHRANAYYQANFALGTAVWNRGVYHGGNTRAWQRLGLQADLAYSIAWAEANAWTVGPEAGGTADADSQACGQPYLDLYAADPQLVRKSSIRTRLEALATSATSFDDWWWIDAFYMAGPVFARLANTEAEPVYVSQLGVMYRHMRDTRGLFDGARGLWYRDATAKARTGANTPQFWGRGNGWVIAACARVLEQLPAGDPARADYVAMLRTMSAALVPLQGTDGFWRSNLLFPSQYPNPETSCTAFFTYAMAYGIAEGLLDEGTYGPVVDRAWSGLTTTALQTSGKLGWVQGIGAAPAAATADGNQDYAYGAFLLAGCEMLRRAGGPAPLLAEAGVSRTLVDTDGSLGETVVLDASGTVRRDSGPVAYSWWLGSVRLGVGPQVTALLPLGTHTVELRAEHADGLFSDTTSVRVTPAPASSVTVSASGAQTGNPAENTLDGSLATRWSQEGDGQWIQFALPVTGTLGEVGIAFYLGDARRTFFDLQVSADGAVWDTVFAGGSSGTTTALERFAFTPRPVRYLRYIGHGNSASAWNSLTEVDIPLAAVLDSADTDADGLPDAWERSQVGDLSPDAAWGDRWVHGGDPADTGAGALLRLTANAGGGASLELNPQAALGPGYVGKTRRFRLESSATLDAGSWAPVAGYEAIPGDNVGRVVSLPAEAGARFYRLVSWLE